MSNQTGDEHRAQGATVTQAPINWRYYFSAECERDQMNKMQFVETTREKYQAHVEEYNTLKHGGRVDIQQVEVDEWYQIKVYHNPAISDIGRRPSWFLVAFSLIDRYHDEFSQFFILEEVEMGVTTKQIGLNNEEVKS